MTRAQKVQLTYYQIMKSTGKVQGDMARTLIQPANAIRVMKEQFTLFARALGNVVIPIIMKVIPYIMLLTKWLTAAAQALARFLGFEINTNGWDNISAGIEDIGDAANGTTKALKKMLAPFDELNVIDFGNNKSGGAGGASGGDLDIPLPEYDALAGALSQNLDEIEKKFKDILPIIEAIGTAFLTWKIGSSVANFLDKLGLIGNLKDALRITFGLSLVIGGAILLFDGIKDISQNGVTPKALAESIVGAVVASLGVAIIAASATAGLVTLGITLSIIWAAVVMSKADETWWWKNLKDGLGLKRENGTYTKDWVIVVDIIIGNYNIVADIFKSIFGEEKWKNIEKQISINLLKTISNAIKNVPVLGSPISRAIDSIINQMQNPIKNSTNTTIQDALDESYRTTIKKEVESYGQNITGDISGGIFSKKQIMNNAITETTKDSLKKAQLNTSNNAEDNGEKQVINIETGIKNKKNELTNVLTNTQKSAIENTQQNTSQVSNKLGVNSISFMENGLLSKKISLTNTLTNDINYSTNNANTSSFKSLGIKSMGDLELGVSKQQNNLSNTLQKTVNNSANAINTSKGKDVGSNFMSGIQDSFNRFGLKIKTPHLSWSSGSQATGWIANILSALSLPTTLPRLSVSWYAEGGFPKEGEAFIARENGPELVGKIGNKSAVANNDQIIEGISQGVSAGVTEAMANTSGKGPTYVYIGNRKVYEGYGEYANSQNNKYGTNIIKV